MQANVLTGLIFILVCVGVALLTYAWSLDIADLRTMRLRSDLMMLGGGTTLAGLLLFGVSLLAKSK